MCFRGGRGSLKAASFQSKSHGSSKMVRDHCKNQPYVLMCFRGAWKLKSRKLPLKKPPEQPNGQKPKKNSAMCALRAAGDRAWTGCSVPGRCCSSLTLKKIPIRFLRSPLAKKSRRILLRRAGFNKKPRPAP